MLIFQYQGFALYRHVLKGDTPPDPKTLVMSGVKDRAWLMLNKVINAVEEKFVLFVVNYSVLGNDRTSHMSLNGSSLLPCTLEYSFTDKRFNYSGSSNNNMKVGQLFILNLKIHN